MVILQERTQTLLYETLNERNTLFQTKNNPTSFLLFMSTSNVSR